MLPIECQEEGRTSNGVSGGREDMFPGLSQKLQLALKPVRYMMIEAIAMLYSKSS